MGEAQAIPAERRLLDRDKFLTVLRGTGREEYTFFNEPVEVDAGDLDRLMADIRRESRRLAGLAAVYLEDDPRGWPVSPRRLVAVYDEEIVNARNQKFDDVLKVVGTRNILQSDFLSIDRYLLENLYRLDCLIRPQRIYGESVDPALPRESEVRFFNISRVQDLLITGYLEPFWVAEVERQVDTRAFLGRLSEFSRLLAVVKEILRRPSVPAWDRLDAEMEVLARDWFRMGLERYRRLMSVVRESFLALFEIIAELDAFFARALVVNMKLEESDAAYRALMVGDSFACVFVERWTPHEALSRMLRLWGSRETFISVLPVAFAVQLLEYTKANNTFCSYIKSCLSTEGLSGNMERSYISWERGKLLNHYRNLLTTLGLDRSERLVFDCNLKSGGAFNKAVNLMNIKKNKHRARNLAKLLRGDA